MMSVGTVLVGALAALSVSSTAPDAAAPRRFACDLALMTPQRQLTAATPVAISFVEDGKALRGIHVVDQGAILYPGSNMRFVRKPDVTSVETVAVPAERPGQWTGVVEKKMFRLTLQSGALANAVEIGIARTPAEQTGRVGLVWNASNQPEGLPQPIAGSGVGNCAADEMKDSQ